jgi:hypothetical protein
MPIPLPPDPVPFANATGCCQPCPVNVNEINVILIPNVNNFNYNNVILPLQSTTIIKV